VKPPPFAYHAPGSLDEALELLGRTSGATALAGGQSLVQQLKFRRVKPAALVDLNRISGLDGIDASDGELRVGALVRQQALLEDETVRARWPLLAEATRYVGYRETRRRGTVGGSLAFAAPWAELTAAAVALNASIEVRSAGGERTVEARSFFEGPYATALRQGELIVGARFPAVPAGTGVSFHEVSARYRDYAQFAVAAVVTPDGKAELVLLRAAETPLLLDATAARADEGALDEVLAPIDPPDDVEASAAYRRRVARALARRALAEAESRKEAA
jgi:CO/xanthine dehydrogenase FAD-binding subunit